MKTGKPQICGFPVFAWILFNKAFGYDRKKFLNHGTSRYAQGEIRSILFPP